MSGVHCPGIPTQTRNASPTIWPSIKWLKISEKCCKEEGQRNKRSCEIHKKKILRNKRKCTVIGKGKRSCEKIGNDQYIVGLVKDPANKQEIQKSYCSQAALLHTLTLSPNWQFVQAILCRRCLVPSSYSLSHLRYIGYKTIAVHMAILAAIPSETRV